MTSQAAADLLREAERTADRLRLVAPRLAARADRGPFEQLATQVRAVLADLEAEGAEAERRAVRAVPLLAPHAWADQVSVLAADVAAAASEAACRRVGAALVRARAGW